jgi:thiamine-phosphate pyrophosphorylase
VALAVAEGSAVRVAPRRNRQPRDQGQSLITCAITHRLDSIAHNLSRADWIQIRAKDLPARDLLTLVEAALRLPNPRSTKIIVNSRIDVALAAGAAGAHLPSASPPAERWRKIVPPGFLIGVSCHMIDEVRAAEAEGAGYVLFGPVFDPLSKTSPLPARGLTELARAAAAVKIPVLALGGITKDNTESCLAAGAAGVAGISLFESC